VADLPRLHDYEGQLALDYETNGTKYWDPDFRVFGVAVATVDQQWYFDIRETPGVAQWVRDTLPGKRVAAHFAQFEAQCTRTLGLDPRLIDWYCTMTAECLIDENQLTYDLESVTRYNLIQSEKSVWLDRMAETMGLRRHSEVLARLSEAPPDLVRGYGSSDVRDCFAIWQNQQKQIDSQELHDVVRLERDLIIVLADMSWGGVRVDLEAAHAAIPRLDEQEIIIAKDIAEATGCKDARTFVNSPKQMREFFKPEAMNKYQWRLIDGTLVGPTKGGGNPSLDQKAMQSMQHPVAKKILALRKTIKLRDTFIRGHVIGSADDRGYVHTTFNQTRNDADAGTVTGRLSSTDPALQQITKRDKANAALLRAMFLSDEGEEWGCFDYSQVDFRCGAHLQNIPDVIEAYRQNPDLDYHQIVADLTGIPRNAPYAGAPYAKQINLGLSFGAGAGKLAFMMGMEHEVVERRGKMGYLPGPKAQEVFETYHSRLPGVNQFMKFAENRAKTNGFVKTLTGRRLRLGRGEYHKAAGLLYQAYAADLHKIGLVRVDRYCRSEKAGRLMMSCHDEAGVSMKPDDRHIKGIQREYTDFDPKSPTAWIKMRVPITSSAKLGANWWEASKD
jgi:DNA polymerase I-like protein with 3'-5' exonuclease and polymerase domains